MILCFSYISFFNFRVMIKCNVSICAVISRAASVKVGKDNNSFLTFSVKLPLEGRDGSKKDLEVSVSLDGDKSKASVFSAGRCVKADGVLHIRKKGGKTYFNLRAGNVELANSKSESLIEGTMEFRGKTGKKAVEEKSDKKGNPYKVFSAFSSDKDGENMEYTWVRFLYFNPKEGEDFLQPSTYVTVKGDLQLSVYKDEVSLDCRVSEVSRWELEKK